MSQPRACTTSVDGLTAARMPSRRVTIGGKVQRQVLPALLRAWRQILLVHGAVQDLEVGRVVIVALEQPGAVGAGPDHGETAAPRIERKHVPVVLQQHQRLRRQRARQGPLRRGVEHLRRTAFVDERLLEEPERQLLLQHAQRRRGRRETRRRGPSAAPPRAARRRRRGQGARHPCPASSASRAASPLSAATR